MLLRYHILWIIAFISQAPAHTRKTALILLRSVADRCTKKVLSTGKKPHKAIIFFPICQPNGKCPMPYQVSCSRATIMNVNFSWGDGNNSSTSFKQLTRGSISHLGIYGCHPMDRHPQASSCRLAIFAIFSTQEKCSCSHHHPPIAARPSSPQSLLSSSQSWWWRVHLSPWKGFCQSLASQP